MDNNSIIDKESFEICTHAEEHPKIFVCDKFCSVYDLNVVGAVEPLTIIGLIIALLY